MDFNYIDYKKVYDFFNTPYEFRSLNECVFKTGVDIDTCLAYYNYMQDKRIIGAYYFEEEEPPQKYMNRYICCNYPINKDSVILEVGPGGNPLFNPNIMPNWYAVDSNYKDGKISYTYRQYDVSVYGDKIKNGSWETLSKCFPDNTFDFIVSSHSFEHVHQPINALKEAYRVLKEGGVLINFVPDGTVMDNSFRLEVTHTLYIVPDMLREFFTYADGFDNLTIDVFRPCFDVVFSARKIKIEDNKKSIPSSGEEMINKIQEFISKPVLSPKILKGEDKVTVVDTTYQDRYTDRNEKKFEIIESVIDFKDKNVLDIGCNNGFFCFKLSPLVKKVIGIDVDENAIINAKKNNKDSNVEFYCSSADSFVSFNKVQITLFLSVYHHVVNEFGIDEARKMLNKISEYTDTMIFESGQSNEQGDFSWKEKLPDNFDNPETIAKEIRENSKFDRIYLIGELPIHGVNRYIFICEKS